MIDLKYLLICIALVLVSIYLALQIW